MAAIEDQTRRILVVIPTSTYTQRQLLEGLLAYAHEKSGDAWHLHLDLTDRLVAMEGIAFGQGDKALHLQNGNSIDICFYLEENSFRGRKTLQMNAQDIKFS